MNEQQSLFDRPCENSKAGPLPDVERFQAAMVGSAVGDALGWPTEFLREDSRRRPAFPVPVRDFLKWQKFVGGRWWGYRDDIGPGEYSDDTQLTLAVARSISSTGVFEPERFAYAEFPLWLHYERGGGRSVKTAARALIRRRGSWLENFYKRGQIDYRHAGANGAAMRNLPIALASYTDERRLVRDSFFNAVISHGHPRAILGAILLGLAVRYALSNEPAGPNAMVEYLRDALEHSGRHVADDARVCTWVKLWEKKGKVVRGTLRQEFQQVRQEAHRYLSAIGDFLQKAPRDYYRYVGALAPETKGSGIATTCVAVFLFLRLRSRPSEALYIAANQLGSDTDTIAAFVGALIGARFGRESIPRHLWERIQDREYLLKTATRLHALACGRRTGHTSMDTAMEQQDAYLRILAWEMGLHEMFWDAIDCGGSVVHPTLGRGVITEKDIRNISREGYVVKLIRIRFDCGQTCIFHSRVENNEKVAESFWREIEGALKVT